MRLVWSDPAVEDLEAIHDYILRDSERYAAHFLASLIEAAETLEAFPQMGRKVPEAQHLTDVRELLFRAYRIIYRQERERVVVLAVIHGSRDLARLPKAPWEAG